MMSDLPNPVPQQANPANMPVMPTQTPVAAAQPASNDPKVLKAQAIEQLEGAIAATAANPAERATKVHEIKAAYIKARYKLDLKGKV